MGKEEDEEEEKKMVAAVSKVDGCGQLGWGKERRERS